MGSFLKWYKPNYLWLCPLGPWETHVSSPWPHLSQPHHLPVPFLQLKWDQMWSALGRSASHTTGDQMPIPSPPISTIILKHPHTWLWGREGIIYNSLLTQEMERNNVSTQILYTHDSFSPHSSFFTPSLVLLYRLGVGEGWQVAGGRGTLYYFLISLKKVTSRALHELVAVYTMAGSFCLLFPAVGPKISGERLLSIL